MYDWGPVYDYEQRKRKSVEENGGNYGVLEWHLPEEEARLNQLLLRQNLQRPKRERVDLPPDADGKRRCLDFWTGQKRCSRTNCKFSHKPAKSDYSGAMEMWSRALEPQEQETLGRTDPERIRILKDGHEDPYDNPFVVMHFPTESEKEAMICEILSVRPQLIQPNWAVALSEYPDRAVVGKFLQEITNGTSIRYEGPADVTHEWDSPLRPGPDQLRLLAALRKEQLSGHFVGPLRKQDIPFPHYITCPVYGVPKTEQFDRHIHDLTVRGSGDAVNAYIHTDQFDIKLPRLRDTM
jgi:hypothetical protein